MIHFHKRKRGEFRDKLKLDTVLTLDNGYQIESKTEIKFLEVYLDSKLTFQTHREMMSAKATSAINTMQSLAGFNWGPTMELLRTLYNSIVVSRIYYCAST